MSLTTRDLSDRHEAWLLELLGGRATKGSGNQWHNQMDGRQNPRLQHYAFSWDGKATLAKSASVSLAMWDKAREQASPAKPLIPLRFYANERLEVTRDLIVVDAITFASMLEDANRFQAAKEQGCLVGNHDWGSDDQVSLESECQVCGADVMEAS